MLGSAHSLALRELLPQKHSDALDEAACLIPIR